MTDSWQLRVENWKTRSWPPCLSLDWLCSSVCAKVACWEPKALHHFNWVSIDVNCHLVHKQFVNTVHREKTKPVDTKSCKWTWKENRF
jgi:hypothetical protein